ncbi:MAG TPA: ROK family protein, partial [Herpetosiphonaceae bacterium]|nr:ROK family protein [Herpetosiphonaceae bacterium]
MILGLDIGGTKTALILGDRTGAVRARRQFPTPLHLGPHAAVEQIASAAQDFLVAEGASGLEAAGVSIGGPLDSVAGVILGPPHLPGWNNIPLRAMLEERLGVAV